MSVQDAPSAPPAHEPGDGRRAAIADLENRLAATPRGARPLEHATLAYRLGLAYAEWPGADGTEGLRKALACYEVAAAIFDPRFDPVEHARVLNAAGAAHRALGNPQTAIRLFQQAATLLEGRKRDEERAAALNNLGLASAENGACAEAIAAFGEALPLFDASTAEGRRGRLAALHNRGLAHAALGTEEGLLAALADYEQVDAEVDAEEAPYHYGLDHHSIGVACSSLAALRPGEREEWLARAVDAFEASLTVFTRSAFPFQYALAKHNLGLAYAGLGGLDDLRRALACLEEAVFVLDARLHTQPWRHAMASLERVERALEESFPGWTRARHFAALVARVDDEERTGLVRERLTRLLALSDPRRHAALVELAAATTALDAAALQAVIEAELGVAMELPSSAVDAVLRARHDVHERLGDRRDEADRALDAAITNRLGAPQRIFVRDFLSSLGWERP